MVYKPKEEVFCEVCEISVVKKNFPRHKGSSTHIKKLNGTYVNPHEPFFCKECEKTYPGRYKKDHYKTDYHLSNVEKKRVAKEIEDDKRPVFELTEESHYYYVKYRIYIAEDNLLLTWEKRNIIGYKTPLEKVPEKYKEYVQQRTRNVEKGKRDLVWDLI